MKNIIALLLILSTTPALADGNKTDLAICQRPQVCPPIPLTQLDPTVTHQGNSFNGPSELVQLLGNGKLPALDASNLTNLPSGGSPGGSSGAIQYNNSGAFGGLPISFNGTAIINGSGGIDLNFTSVDTLSSFNMASGSGIHFDTPGSFLHLDNAGNATLQDSFGTRVFLDGAGTAAVTGNASISGNLSSINTVSYTWTASQGGVGTVLTNDGSGNLSWAAATAGAGGSDTQIQFNSGGVLTGSPNLTYNGSAFLFATDGTWHDTGDTNILTIDGGGITLNSSQTTWTSGAYTFNDTSNGILTMNVGNFHYVDGTAQTNFQIDGSGVHSIVPPTAGTIFGFEATDQATYFMRMYNDGTYDYLTDGLFADLQIMYGGSIFLNSNSTLLLNGAITATSTNGSPISFIGGTKTTSGHGAFISFQAGNGTGGARPGHIQFKIQTSTNVVSEFDEAGQLHVYKTLLATATGANYSVQSSSGINMVAGSLTAGYEKITNTCAAATTCTSSCTAGKVVTGGGCNGGSVNLSESFPATNASWECDTLISTTLNSYALCSRIGGT